MPAGPREWPIGCSEHCDAGRGPGHLLGRAISSQLIDGPPAVAESSGRHGKLPPGRYRKRPNGGRDGETRLLLAAKAEPARKVKSANARTRMLESRRFHAMGNGGDMLRNGCLAYAAAVTAALVMASSAGAADKKTIERGKYLVTFGGCFDCHTPGYFFGKPDMARYLGGSDVGFEMPGLGVFVGPNLTPDPETGLGQWSEAQIVTALQTGKRPDGRELAPIMPWRSFASLSRSDAHAIAAFLKSLPPVSHKVPGPFGPDEKVSVFRMKVVPPEAAAAR
jgi:mono/diheme cytochrome c family protein